MAPNSWSLGAFQAGPESPFWVFFRPGTPEILALMGVFKARCEGSKIRKKTVGNFSSFKKTGRFLSICGPRIRYPRPGYQTPPSRWPIVRWAAQLKINGPATRRCREPCTLPVGTVFVKIRKSVKYSRFLNPADFFAFLGRAAKIPDPGHQTLQPVSMRRPDIVKIRAGNFTYPKSGRFFGFFGGHSQNHRPDFSANFEPHGRNSRPGRQTSPSS